MVKDLSTNSIFITCSFIESTLYGATFVLFVHSIQSLLRQRRIRDHLNAPLVIAAPILFAFATLHIFGVWARTYIGFVSYPQGPAAYWALITTPEKTMTQVGQLGAVALGDSMMVYRAWLVWERNLFVIIVPTLTLISTFVCGIAFVTVQHQVNVHTSIFQSTVTRWTEAWLASSICTTGICTALIVVKLALIQYQLRDPSSLPHSQTSVLTASTRSIMSRVIWIVVESAAMYSAVNLLYCVLYSAALNPEAWFSTMDAPVASISFSLIIIRAERIDTKRGFITRGSRSHDQQSLQFNTDIIDVRERTGRRWSRAREETYNSDNIQLQEVAATKESSRRSSTVIV